MQSIKWDAYRPLVQLSGSFCFWGGGNGPPLVNFSHLVGRVGW